MRKIWLAVGKKTLRSRRVEFDERVLDALLVLEERQHEDGGGDEADDDPGGPIERHTSVDRDQQRSDADREQEAADHVEGVVLAAVGCGEDEPCEGNGDRHAELG